MTDKIKVMPASLANLIAAGEVVERPASALKELVENAIDAKAKHIYVDISGGGLKALVVKDDGIGMSNNDAKLCLLRHASSKLMTAYDLTCIKTLGFRGEALPSIVAVSRLVLDTSDGNEGTHLEAHGEEKPLVARGTLRQGTTVKVTDLFYNTPARLKYMKAEQVERAKCLEVLERLAVGFSAVSFEVRTDGKIVFTTSGRHDPLEVIQSIWGNDLAKRIIKVSDSQLGFAIEAFLARPEINYASRFQIMLFLNQRHIYSYKLTKAVEEAYRDYLAPLRYPFAVINIALDPALIDVNVHPTKREVRISNEEELARTLKVLIKKALTEVKPTYSNRGNVTYLTRNADEGLLAVTPTLKPSIAIKVQQLNPYLPAPSADNALLQDVDNVSFQGNDRIETEKLIGNFTRESADGQLATQQANIKMLSEENTLYKKDFNPYKNLLPLGQVAKTYIVCESPEGLCIVDQHAAAERINFEKIEKAFADVNQSVQPLQPVVIELPPSVVSTFNDAKKELLKPFGLTVNAFGTAALKLDSLPVFLTDKNYDSVIRDLIVSVVQGQKASPAELMRKALATLACKASVRAGQELSMLEQVSLLKNLSQCRNPANCPHGRPTVIKMSIGDLEHLFKRTGF